MTPFGKFHLETKSGNRVPVEVSWMSKESDWEFISAWEQSPDYKSSRFRDSIEYARTGSKRWKWLLDHDECVVSMEDAVRKSQVAREGKPADMEFGFCLAVSLTERKVGRIIGFCYARKLWTNSLCLEFFGALELKEIGGTGTLLFNCLAAVSQRLGVDEIWGECTADSQSYYQNLKAKLLLMSLERSRELLKQRKEARFISDWQLPGGIRDRFSFGLEEIHLLTENLGFYARG